MFYGLLHFNAKIAHRLLLIFYVRKQIFKVAQHRQKIESSHNVTMVEFGLKLIIVKAEKSKANFETIWNLYSISKVSICNLQIYI